MSQINTDQQLHHSILLATFTKHHTHFIGIYVAFHKIDEEKSERGNEAI